MHVHPNDDSGVNVSGQMLLEGLSMKRPTGCWTRTVGGRKSSTHLLHLETSGAVVEWVGPLLGFAGAARCRLQLVLFFFIFLAFTLCVRTR